MADSNPKASANYGPVNGMYKHGLSDTPTHNIWQKMRRRCGDPTSPDYPRWGGRGIIVCDRWQSFENFVADMSEKPSPAHSIERVDNSGPYSPENCVWATPKEQARNRRNNKLLTVGDETKCQAEWAEQYGIPEGTIYARIKHGWSPERAITTPVRAHKVYKNAHDATPSLE